MRTLRTTLLGAVMLALLAGSGTPLLAQSDDATVEPSPAITPAPTPAAVTGALEFVGPESESAIADQGDAVTHDEATLHVHEWTSSDPRLSGTASYTGTWHLYNPPAEDCDDPDAEAGAAYEIVTDDGSWRCGGFRAPIPGPDGAENVHTLVFRGAGGYEGLSAYVLIDWSTSPYTFSALITPNSVPIVPVMQG